MRHRSSATVLLAAVALASTPHTRADEFRAINPIPGLELGGRKQVARPVDRAAAEHALRAVFQAWNTPDLRLYLATEFQDRTQLLDQLTKIPRNATLRLLALESVDTLAQTSEAVPGRGDVVKLTSTIAAVARTQIEFDDPQTGFQRLEGVDEYVFHVTQVVPR